jgi:two-component system, chemotaxis family, chemotaxis protein CheY
MKQILVVDDSTSMRRMVMASLRQVENVKFCEASNGLEAIERIALETMNLVILDLNMPDMHGLEVLKFIRQHQSFSHVPVIILTTRGDESSQSEAIAAGVSLYCTKPFNPSIFAGQVAELLQ